MTLLPGIVGLSLGMRHALEPDHLAAVSTLASEERGARAGVFLGVFWGLGHTLSLVAVAGSLTLLGTHMPVAVSDSLELAVALMVIFLGIRTIARALREGNTGTEHTHLHHGKPHRHAAPLKHVHLNRWTLATRPLLIGLMHGLAGSGALTTLVLLEQPTASARLSYIALFGMGSIVGMALLTGLAGIPMMRLAQAPRMSAALMLGTGLLSTTIGAWWGVNAWQHLAG